MGFFDKLNAACEARNAELDKLYEEKRQRQLAAEAEKERENRLKKRGWAVRLLEEGSTPVEQGNKIFGAMMTLIADEEVWRNELDRLLMKHEHYRSIISQSLVEKFLEHGGDPAGELGAFCVEQALALEPGLNLFEPGFAEPLATALLILARLGNSENPQIAGAYKLLRRLVPFVRDDNSQNIPHKLGIKLYPEHYGKDGKCTYKFASRLEESEAREVGKGRCTTRPERSERGGNNGRPKDPFPKEKYVSRKGGQPHEKTDEPIDAAGRAAAARAAGDPEARANRAFAGLTSLIQ